MVRAMGFTGEKAGPLKEKWIAKYNAVNTPSASAGRPNTTSAAARARDQPFNLVLHTGFVSLWANLAGWVDDTRSQLASMLRRTMSRLLIPANKEQNVLYIR
jgi:hypothetical protein